MMNGSYNVTLLILSYLISVGGSLTALLLARKAIASRVASHKMTRMFSAAVALGGVGIWAMHFIGMLAFSLCTNINYDPTITLISFLPALLACQYAVSMLVNSNGNLKILLH